MATIKVSASSQALEQLLKEDGATARLARETGIHRTQLWRYSTGKGKPDADQIAKIHRATEGAIAAEGWETIKAEREETDEGAEAPPEPEKVPA